MVPACDLTPGEAAARFVDQPSRRGTGAGAVGGEFWQVHTAAAAARARQNSLSPCPTPAPGGPASEEDPPTGPVSSCQRVKSQAKDQGHCLSSIFLSGACQRSP